MGLVDGRVVGALPRHRLQLERGRLGRRQGFQEPAIHARLYGGVHENRAD